MFKIECTGLTLREARELEEHVRQVPGVNEIDLDLNLKGVIHTRSVQASAPHFYLLVHAAAYAAGVAAGGLGVAAGKGAAEELGKDVYKAIRDWMGRFSEKSHVEIEVKLYGPDNKPIQTIRKTR